VQVDVRLDEVVLHALEKEPARRYQQVSQVKTAIDTISASAAPTARISSPPVVAAAAAPTQGPDRFWRRFAVVVIVFMGIITILAPIIIVAFRVARVRAANEQQQVAQARNRKVQVLQQIASPQTGTASSQLVIDAMPFDVAHPEPGQMDWGFKCFIPPYHLASFLFVRWTNGVPVVDPGFSTYFKVGKAGGIDLPFCHLSCHRIPESREFSQWTDDERRQLLAEWNFPEAAGVTNAVRWDVNLGAGFTASRWIAMPPYNRVETKLPLSVRSGHQRAIRLVDFERPEGDGNHGQAGVELRIILEPLTSPPIRTVPNESNRTNYVVGTGLFGTIEEALNSMKNLPIDP
jgi:hypothetical protein